MKRQVSVSIFLAVLVIVLAWLYIKFNNETNPNENQITTENNVSKEEAVTISQQEISYPYYIKIENGRLVVYESKNHEIYMETSIEVITLSEEMLQRVENGIYFQSEAELYDFLESYSS